MHIVIVLKTNRLEDLIIVIRTNLIGSERKCVTLVPQLCQIENRIQMCTSAGNFTPNAKFYMICTIVLNYRKSFYLPLNKASLVQSIIVSYYVSWIITVLAYQNVIP